VIRPEGVVNAVQESLPCRGIVMPSLEILRSSLIYSNDIAGMDLMDGSKVAKITTFRGR
jgi:hypothetical protein